MTIEYIRIGQTANDQTGDPLRTAFAKVNNNFATLASTGQPGGPPGALQYRATNNLTAIAYLNGTYLAAGYPERVFTSTDQITWAPQNSSLATTLTAITTDGTQFIGVGANGIIATTLDGVTWTQQTTGTTFDFRGVAFGGGYYIAVGANGAIVRSTDTVNWVTITSPTAQTLTSVVYSVGQAAFIATGTAGTILTSADGGIWSQQTSGVSQDLYAAATYNNLVIIAGADGRILASLDLFNWNIRTSGTTADLFGITVATLGAAVTAFAVGSTGTIVTSSDAGFITWNDTAYASPTTETLVAAATLDVQVSVIGAGGTIFTTTGGSWSDTGIPAGIDGSATLTFDPQNSLVSVGADIVPQTTDLWSLGTQANRWKTGYYSADGGVEIGAVAATEFGGSLELVSAANSSVRAGLIASTVTSNSVTANTTTTGNLTVSNTAAIVNLEVTGNTTLANLQVANVTVNNITTNAVTANTVTAIGNIVAANAIVTGSVTATIFYGDGSQLTGIVNKASGIARSVQFAAANLDFDGTANFTFNAATGTLSAPNIVTDLIVTTDIVADDIAAATLRGDGGNITGLPVMGLVAGANISLVDNSGIWTITAIGDGNTQSHGVINSVQFAGPAGTFNSVPGFTYDVANASLELASSNITAKRVFANVTGTLDGNVAGNLVGDFVIANTVTATTVTANIVGNVNAVNGTITDLTVSNLDVTGVLEVDDFTANTATIAGIDFANNTISSTSTVTVVSTDNLTLSTADSLVNGQSASNVSLVGGIAAGLANGGSINILSGSGGTSGNAGNILIVGAAGGTAGSGGAIAIRGGYGNLAAGGDIEIIAGDTLGDPSTIAGAQVYIQGGNTVNEDGGAIRLLGGNATGPGVYGGNIYINGGTGTQGAGNIYIADLRWPLTDGAPGAFLGTNGAGNLEWVTDVFADGIINGTSNVLIPQANGNIRMGVGGTPNVVIVTSNGLVSSNITTSGNVNAAIVKANRYFGVDANFTGNVVLGNVTLTGNVAVASINNGNTHVRAGANSAVTFEVAGIPNAMIVDSTETTINGNLIINGTVSPVANVTYDLGTNTNRWRDLYLANNTIFIGDATIKSWQNLVLLRGLSITTDGQIDPGNVPANGDIFVANNLSAGNAVLSNSIQANTIVADDAQFNVVSGNTANFVNLTAANLLITGNIDVSQIENGTSNVNIPNTDGNITFGVSGVSNVLTVTDTTVLANSYTANNFILGDATTTACRTLWHKTQTATSVPNQVLFEMPAAGQNSVDFKIISVDVPNFNKQSSMITTVTYGTNTSYSEYARSVINTVISDLSVDQTNGNIRLLASPRVAYLVRYTVIVSIY